MSQKISLVGITALFVVVLISASAMSTAVLNTQQVVAKSSEGIGQMIENMSKLGVVVTSTPVMCISMGDMMGVIKSKLSGMVGDVGNLTNMAGMDNMSISAPETMKSMMNSTGGKNQTGDMQGMLTNLINQSLVSGTENMSDTLMHKARI